LYYKELKAGVEYTLNDGGAEYIKDIEFCFMCDQLPDPPCPNENKVCHDGTVLNRLAPSCDFAECPPCPADQMECPDGTMLARDFGDSCRYPECPPCDDDTFTCPNGDVLVRDASNCEFPLCGPCDVLTKECPGGEVLEVNVDTCDFADCPTPDVEPEPEISTRAFTKGDPHFKTFGGEMYDFHGECDLVLLHNPQFKNGLGMDIHIRTKISDWWSSVETAAVKIGNDTLEITGAGSKFLWINGKENEDMDQGVFYKSTMAGYLVRYRIKGAVREAHIHFGSKDHQEKLVIKAYKEFVRVDVDYEGSDSYVGSVGLLGSRDLDGLRVGRDMKTLIQSHNEFGQEWQVREDEPKLFHSNEGAVQAPNKCILPVTTPATTQLRRRRLAESGLTMDAIEVACSHLTSPAERKGCVDDVVATQDMDMAAVW
jgi:hypothetical protein